MFCILFYMFYICLYVLYLYNFYFIFTLFYTLCVCIFYFVLYLIFIHFLYFYIFILFLLYFIFHICVSIFHLLSCGNFKCIVCMSSCQKWYLTTDVIWSVQTLALCQPLRHSLPCCMHFAQLRLKTFSAYCKTQAIVIFCELRLLIFSCTLRPHPVCEMWSVVADDAVAWTVVVCQSVCHEGNNIAITALE